VEKDKKISTKEKVLGTAAALSAPLAMHSLVSSAAKNQMDKHISTGDFYSDADAEKREEEIKRAAKNHTDVKVEGGLDKSIYKAHYNPSTNKVHNYGNSEAVLAHELGHARTKRRIGTIAGLGLSYRAGMLAPLYTTYKGATGQDLSTKEKAVSTGLMVPLLAEETIANAKAAKTLYNLGGMKKVLRNKNALLASEISYAGIAGMPIVGYHVSRKIKDLYEKRKQNKLKKLSCDIITKTKQRVAMKALLKFANEENKDKFSLGEKATVAGAGLIGGNMTASAEARALKSKAATGALQEFLNKNYHHKPFYRPNRDHRNITAAQWNRIYAKHSRRVNRAAGDAVFHSGLLGVGAGALAAGGIISHLKKTKAEREKQNNTKNKDD
jgi:hypothetical protein